MNKDEIQATIERYNARLSQYGVSEKALGWGDKGRSKLRHEVLTSRWNLDESSIVDFGCGFGDLYLYLLEKGIRNVKYTGIDINENLVNIARERCKGDVRFIVDSLLTSTEDFRCDFLMSSGVFNYLLANNKQFIIDCFDKFNAIAEKGFAVNFLSDKVDYTHDYTYHSNPSWILDLCYKYSNNIVLRNDYMPFEFTIFVDKQSQVDPEFTVYKDFKKYL